MPSPEKVVVNTGPLIALCAGMGDLEILRQLYREVFVPVEVEQEIAVLRQSQFVQPVFLAAKQWLRVWPSPAKWTPWLRSSLDLGEASVIQLALDTGIQTVVIDEAAGRRVARLSGLAVAGSVGLLLRAKKEGFLPAVKPALDAMRTKGVWLGEAVMRHALHLAGE